MLKILDHIPAGFLEAQATELYKILPEPTLIHLKGARDPAIFVSILLHGHETTGLTVIQKLLHKYQQKKLPRSLTIFVGNVHAARYNQRRLDSQPDFNRIWQEGPLPEHRIAEQILNEMAQRKSFASIDIHNNTGINPHYACVTRLDHQCFHLATLFSRTVIYFTRPSGVQTNAFRNICPAVTLECGQVGQSLSENHAMEYLDACLHLSKLPDHPVAAHDIDLFHSVATVSVPESFSFGFESNDTDLSFISNLDHLNFNELEENTLLGRINSNNHARLLALDEWDKEVTDRYFSYDNGEIRTRCPFMLSMLTLNEEIIRQDCFGYIMERMSVP